MIGVGIIGCGRISGLHAAAYRNRPGAAVVAAADPVAASLDRQGEAWHLPRQARHADYRELLTRPDVDMVEILVPHHLHATIAIDAMDAGKHVSLQKPMAITLDEADAMISRARERGVLFKVFENFLFYPPVRRAKAIIDAGEIGEVLSIRLKSNSGWSPTAWPVPRQAEAWRADPGQCGGGPMVFDDGHHKFALAWYFLGSPTLVHAFIGSTGGLDSPSLVSWTCGGQKVGSLETVRSPGLRLDTAHYAQDDRVEITGTQGVLWVTRGHGKMLDAPPVVVYRDGKTTGHADMTTDWAASFTGSGEQFLDAIG